MSNEPSLLEVAELTKRFGGVTAVNRCSLALAAGRIYGLIGPNGSGKTTLFNCITGLAVSPLAGRGWTGTAAAAVTLTVRSLDWPLAHDAPLMHYVAARLREGAV